MFDGPVEIVDTSGGVVEWSWDMSAEFGPKSGGDYPSDRAHLNDVERVRTAGS